jgi:Icc-related predicted phosphoesterase
MEASMPKDKRKVRIAAVGDLHCNKSSQGAFQPLFSEINDTADLLVLCGDLTDYGLPEEAHVLAHELTALRVPVLAVLGNHDFESGKQVEVAGILSDAGVLMLDGDAHEVAGVGFAGTKGFAGGFGTATLAPWGEQAIKTFVQEGVNEAFKLEKAVARLRTPHKIVVLHYAPIQHTVEGEPEAIFPFLGTSRLEEPLARYSVSAVFHGHAHRGTFEGRTMSGTPVYNVSMPLLKRDFPHKPPFYLFELPHEPTPDLLIDGRVTAEVS